jgi:beta-phosphoglucomutase
MALKAVIFDLDGVIVSTDESHYQAWQELADAEGIYFDRTINQRLRGVSRMESLEILLERSQRTYSPEEKIVLAFRKNTRYLELLKNLTPADLLPGALEMLQALKAAGVAVAIGSSSKNTWYILERIGLARFFDAVADGNDIAQSKPDPEVFLIAADRLGVRPRDCLVVEDARAGVEAALAAGMKALAVGYAAGDERATARAESLAEIGVKELLSI